MKKVFNNDMCAHVWAQQSQSEGRTANKSRTANKPCGPSMHFEGPVLYSYQTPIAAFVSNADGGQRVALVTCESYSVTTRGKHIGPAHRALRNTARVFVVPDLGVSGGRTRTAYNRYAENPYDGMHAANVAHLIARFDNAAAAELKRNRWYDSDNAAEMLTELQTRVTEYCAAFALLAPSLDVAGKVDAIRARRERLANSPARIARAAEMARRGEELTRQEYVIRAARDAKLAENLEAWLRGESIPNHMLPRLDGAQLRVIGDTVQTSWGAEVRIQEARDLLAFVRVTMRRGIDRDFRGSNVTVGPFSVNKIAANGDLEIGCHTIKWAAVERIIPQLEVQS